MTTSAPSATIGDIVVCPDDAYRRNHHIPDEPLLVIALRKGQARLFLPSVLGESWVPDHQLSRVRNTGTAFALPGWMRRIWFLAKTLPSVEIEVERFGEGENAVRIFVEEVHLKTLDELRERMGGELRYLALAPAGMHRLECAIGFVIDEGRRW